MVTAAATRPCLRTASLLKRAAAEGSDQEPSLLCVFTGCRPRLASQGHGPRVRSPRSCDPSPRSASCWLFRPAGCFGSPALPAAIWECREEETWLPPGDNARENLGSTSRRGRKPASLPSPHLYGTSGSRSHAEAFWVRVYFPYY